MLSTPFLVMQCLVPALAVTAGVALLWRRARSAGTLSALDLARAGLWMAGASGLATIFGTLAGTVQPFGVIRMGFLVGVVSVPVVGALLLGARLRGRIAATPSALGLAALGCLAAPLGAWMAWVEPYDLRVEEATLVLPAERAGVAPLRIGVLADLQCEAVGDHERRAVATLLAQEPDLILVPGDLFQGSEQEFERWREPLMELLATLRAPGGVYFVPGDTDHAWTIAALRESTDWKILISDVVEVRVRDRRLRIAGMANRASFGIARELESMRGDDDVRIVMSHAPDTVLHMKGRPRVDLIVAGHTHGGQIVVPGFGPPITLSRVPREIAGGGLHTYEGRAIYVSRGVGLERRQAPRVRLLCPPEVSMLTLTSTATQTP